MPPALCITSACEVCGQTAHGKHFGAISCRACAAFFRRAGKRSSKSQDIVCSKGNCTTAEDGTFYCKACRLKKCHEVGMDSSKFQNDRDLISNCSQISKPSKLSSPQSLANFLGRPEMILPCEPENASTSKVIIDLSFLINKAVDVFHDSVYLPSPCNFGNSLEKMVWALEDLNAMRFDTKVEFQTKIGQHELFSFWEGSFIKTVKWFSKFPEFMELPMHVKLEIVKSSWLIWIRLDQQAQTANLRRKQFLGDDLYMSGEGRCMNLKSVEIDFGFITKYSNDQIQAFMNPDKFKPWKLSIDELKEYVQNMSTQKCLTVGMDVTKFQKNRDPISNSYCERSKIATPKSLANFLGRPESILCFEPDRASSTKTVIDVSYLLEKATHIFQQDPSYLGPYEMKSSLERVTYAMDAMKSKKMNHPLSLSEVIGKTETFLFYESTFLEAAHWLAEFPELQQLNVEMDILKSAWTIWMRLDALAETAEYNRLNRRLDNGIQICTSGAKLKIEEIKMDLRWCTNYSAEQIERCVSDSLVTLN
ncbi:hypothetical protein L3Y34_006919 [Caenorhabditis briggsae]|uniref:Nuclear Hormone Receptor family n=1 Tax=Caenorhabditis briggsae TaxID=6238 RepID=A0AAE8ZXI5_CAEBR|nr:hypothetical protein L3Y34_006919 [Caenorhabditis briggsae]